MRITKVIKSVLTALNILEVFQAPNHQELGITEISRLLGLNKTTVFHLVSTMEMKGYIQKNKETGKYKLGLKLFELGNLVGERIDIQKQAVPFLRKLVEKFSETVHLVILDRDEALYIEKVEGTMNVRIPSQVGKRNPLHCTGVGKVLMAHLDEESVERIIREKGLRRFTNNTICDPQLLKKELSKVKEQGYALDNEEIEPGLRCIAAPVKNHLQKVVAAISMAAPASRLSDENLHIYIREVIEAAKGISYSLGYKEEKDTE